MAAFEQLLGSKLLSKSKGEVKTADALAGKDAVLLYFSAHWCPPCKQYTPMLANFYKTHHAAKKFEIVFVSSDNDEAQFKHYFEESHGDWLAVPYSDRDAKAKLGRKFKVQGIPTLVVLDGNAGLITTEGRMYTVKDRDAKDFPWRPKSFWQILGDNLIDNQMNKVPVESLKSKTALGIYFSASWCGPCRAFMPTLTACYNKIPRDQFELIFVSSDNGDAEFKEYFKKMPWLAVPFEDDDRRSDLAERFGIEGIPTLIIVDAKTGNVITTEGRQEVENDTEAKDFPWRPKPVNPVGGEALNEEPCFLLLLGPNGSEELKSSLVEIGASYWKQWEGLAEKPVRFMYSVDKRTQPLEERIRQLLNLGQGPKMLVVNLPAQEKYVFKGGDITKDSMKTFIADYIAGKVGSDELDA